MSKKTRRVSALLDLLVSMYMANSSVLQGRGKIIEADEIRFDAVPLISPNGDVLVKSMSFNVEPGVRKAPSAMMCQDANQ